MKALLFLIGFTWSWMLPASTDSLLQLLPTTEGKEQVHLLIQLSTTYEQIDLDSALLFAEQAVQKATVLEDEALLAEAFNEKGIILDYLGEYEQALTSYAQALRYYRSLGDKKGETGTLINIGLVKSFQAQMDSALLYYDSALTNARAIGLPSYESYVLHNISSVHLRQSHYRLALDYLLQSLSLKEELGDVQGQIMSLYNLGLVYYNLKLPQTALDHYHKLLTQYEQELDNMTEGDTYHNMGMIYQNALSNADSALLYYRKALAIREQLGYREGVVETISNLSMLQLALGKPDTAIAGIKRALTLCMASKDWAGLALNQSNLAKIQLYKGQYDAALASVNRAEQIIDSFSIQQDVTTVLKTKVDVLRQLGRFNEALTYYDRYTQLSDSMLNANISEQLLELETQYQTAKKDRSILQQQITLDNQALVLARKNRWIAIIGFGLLATSLILLLLIKNQRQRKSLYQQELATLKKEQELQRLKAVMAGEEQERTRIAKNLHDGVSGMLSAIKLYFTSLSRNTPGLEQEEPFTKARSLLDDTATEVRAIAHNLMPDILLRDGLVAALRQFCDHIESSGLVAVDYQVINMEEKLPQPIALTLYRIVQELLNNILKHAEATEILIQIARQGQRIECTVEDNGKGFTLSSKQQGTGLEAIRHRIQHMEGELDIDTKEGQGTSVHISIHLDKRTIT